MKRKVAYILIFFGILALIYLFLPGYFTAIIPSANANQIKNVKLPSGFEIGVYAENVAGARSLCLTRAGTLFVGSRREGKVYAVLDTNKDFKADEIITIISGLNNPNGIAFKEGALYVAEISRVLKFDNIENNLDSIPEFAIVNASFPADEHHGWKFIAFGPDNKLYVPVGAPCNICLEKDARYASIMRMNPDGSNLEIFAKGIRNTVGFDWHPETEVLWFTDNGRDWMGDDIPPDELNRAPEPGMHFGFPFCHGKGIQDPEFRSRECSEFTPPELELGPHVAALGMRFYTGTMFPEKYRGGIFIAEHGSWNRTTPIGYRVMFVQVKENKAISKEVFAEGWLAGSTSWGRPVDLEIMPDGSLLLSDDKSGTIYRIKYKGD